MADPLTGHSVEQPLFGVETTAGTKASTIDAVFGRNISINPSGNRNMNRSFDMGTREATALTEGQWEGSLTINSELSSGFIMRIAGFNDDGGTGTNPTTWTYTPETGTQTSFSTLIPVDLSGIDKDIVCLGCKTNRIEITGELQDKVKTSWEIKMLDLRVEDTATTGTSTYNEDPFVAKNITVEVPGSTTIDKVQSFTWTVLHDNEAIHGMGSATPTDIIDKGIKPSLSLTVTVEALTDFLQEHTGASSLSWTVQDAATSFSDAKLIIDNGQTGADKNSITITLSELYVDEDSIPMDPNEKTDEEVTLIAEKITDVVVKNGQATHPGGG